MELGENPVSTVAPVTIAYLAADGYATQLATELAAAGVTIVRRHGDLLVSEDAPIAAAWARNTWFDAEYLPVGSIREAAEEQIHARLLIKRAGTAEEVARLALFLATPANAYMTGQVLHLDGGLKMA